MADPDLQSERRPGLTQGFTATEKIERVAQTESETNMNTRTSETNGRLWGAKARDWAEVQEGQCAAAFHAVLAHAGVGAGTRHLDVGCGAGMAATLSASLGATVAGIDAAESMLQIARERTPGGDFRQGDLELLPFANASFDLVTGFNAFQYAGDPAQALREAGRVTRPGGMIVIMTWGEPAGMDAASVVGAMKPLLPPAPPGAPGPFALSDESALRAFAVAGGLTPGAVFDVDTPWFYRDEAAALRGLGSAGVAIRAIEHSGEEAFIAAHRAALAPFRHNDGSFRIGARFRCLVAAP
jgi:SAM-dependent methyltransferase